MRFCRQRQSKFACFKDLDNRQSKIARFKDLDNILKALEEKLPARQYKIKKVFQLLIL